LELAATGPERGKTISLLTEYPLRFVGDEKVRSSEADDLFGMPNGTPITDRIIEASIQWAERIMQRIDTFHPE
jgi:hypothetical protein